MFKFSRRGVNPILERAFRFFYPGKTLSIYDGKSLVGVKFLVEFGI